MANIDDFKANLLGGGARANQFRVTINPPTGIATGLLSRKTSFLVKSSSLPAMTVGEIPVSFRGRQIFIAGDRTFGETWSTTFINDTDFMIRNAMERWSNGINDLADNTGIVDPTSYQTDLTVEQLDRDDVLRECRRRRHFRKPSAVKRQKIKEAKFKAYLDARDARD